jgi:hypothetical protein
MIKKDDPLKALKICIVPILAHFNDPNPDYRGLAKDWLMFSTPEFQDFIKSNSISPETQIKIFKNTSDDGHRVEVCT